MSVFTNKEIEYLQSQRLARLATVQPEGKPQIAPVGFRYDAEQDVIYIGRQYLSRSKKFRNILNNPYIALVIDDVLSKEARIDRALFLCEQLGLTTPSQHMLDLLERVSSPVPIGY